MSRNAEDTMDSIQSQFHLPRDLEAYLRHKADPHSLSQASKLKPPNTFSQTGTGCGLRIGLKLDRIQSRTLSNTVMNFRHPKTRRFL